MHQDFYANQVNKEQLNPQNHYFQLKNNVFGYLVLLTSLNLYILCYKYA